jgi:hypothetical protein
MLSFQFHSLVDCPARVTSMKWACHSFHLAVKGRQSKAVVEVVGGPPLLALLLGSLHLTLQLTKSPFLSINST